MVSVDVKHHVYLLTHGGLHRHLSYNSLLLSSASFRPVDGTIESPGTAGRLGDELTLPLVNTITALNSSFLDTFCVNKDPPFPVYRLLLGHTNLLTSGQRLDDANLSHSTPSRFCQSSFAVIRKDQSNHHLHLIQ